MDWLWILAGFVVVAAWLGWKQLTFVSAGMAREFLKNGAKVVDVRGPGEFHSRHLPSAINIPVDQLRQQILTEFPNKETVLLLHCAGGVRSGMGKNLLQQMGYVRVFNLGSYGRAQRILQS